MKRPYAAIEADIPNPSFGESQNNQPIADDQSMLRRLFPV
jgi:hypothetical protein